MANPWELNWADEAPVNATREAMRVPPATQQARDKEAVQQKQQEYLHHIEQGNQVAADAVLAELRRTGATPSTGPSAPAPVQAAPAQAPVQPAPPAQQVTAPGSRGGRFGGSFSGSPNLGIDAGAVNAYGVNVARGLTGGASKYMYGIPAFVSGKLAGEDVTYQGELNKVQGEYDRLQQEYPNASTAGYLTGSLGLGSRLPSSTAPKLIGSGAAVGAVSGFSASPWSTAKQAGTDLLTGGTIGGLLSSLPAMGAAFIKGRTLKGLDKSIERGEKAVKDATKEASDALRNARVEAKLAAGTSSKVSFDDLPAATRDKLWAKMTPAEQAAVTDARAAVDEVTHLKKLAAAKKEDLAYLAARKEAVKAAPALALPGFTKSLGGEPRGTPGPLPNTEWVKHRLKKDVSRDWQQLRATAPGAVGGGAIGAATSLATGGDPMQGFLYGAGAGSLGMVAMNPQIRSAGMNIAAGGLRHPVEVARYGATTAAGVSAEQGVKAMVPAPAASPWEMEWE